MNTNIRILFCTLLSLFGATLLSAQSYVGIRGGYGMGSARFFPARESKMVGGLMSAGVSYKYFSSTRFVGAVEFDLQYFQRGFEYYLLKDSDTSYRRTINSIELPFLWHPHVYVFNRNGRVFFNLGLNLTYNIDSYYKDLSKANGVLSEGNYQMLLVRDNRWGYGLVGGVGFSVFIGRLELLAEGRYYFGYSDILKNHTKYAGNPLRSPLDNINISFGLYYRLGKGGIKAAPSKKMAQRIAERDARRQAKDMVQVVDSTVVDSVGVELLTMPVDSTKTTDIELIDGPSRESQKVKNQK